MKLTKWEKKPQVATPDELNRVGFNENCEDGGVTYCDLGPALWARVEKYLKNWQKHMSVLLEVK